MDGKDMMAALFNPDDFDGSVNPIEEVAVIIQEKLAEAGLDGDKQMKVSEFNWKGLEDAVYTKFPKFPSVFLEQLLNQMKQTESFVQE